LLLQSYLFEFEGRHCAEKLKMSQAFALHQDENQMPRRGKGAIVKGNGLGGQKRAALGVITNQVNQNLRVQPARAAKPKVSFCSF
jgi:hypothetical protein